WGGHGPGVLVGARRPGRAPARHAHGRRRELNTGRTRNTTTTPAAEVVVTFSALRDQWYSDFTRAHVDLFVGVGSKACRKPRISPPGTDVECTLKYALPAAIIA